LQITVILYLRIFATMATSDTVDADRASREYRALELQLLRAQAELAQLDLAERKDLAVARKEKGRRWQKGMALLGLIAGFVVVTLSQYLKRLC